MSGRKRKRIVRRVKARKSVPANGLRTRPKKATKVPPGVSATFAVTMKSKSGRVMVFRSTQTGRLTTNRSAAVIDTGTERFAGALKRLANK